MAPNKIFYARLTNFWDFVNDHLIAPSLHASNFFTEKFTFPHFSIPTTLKNLWRTFSENLVGSAFSSSITTTLSSQFFRILMRKFSRKTRIIVLFGALIQNSLVNPNQIKWIVTFLVHPTSHFSVKYNQKSMKKCVVLAACSVLILCVNC